MGKLLLAVGGAAGAWAMLKAWEIQAKMQGWSYVITEADRMGIMAAGALLGISAQDIAKLLKKME